jgi:4-amino-4-deoxy-L-arabinose transferase-like glycosyltransferase
MLAADSPRSREPVGWTDTPTKARIWCPVGVHIGGTGQLHERHSVRPESGCMATSTLHPSATTTGAAPHRSPSPSPAQPSAPSDERGSWTSRPAVLRGSVIALLVGTAVLYLWGLSASGYANSFYSAAVQAGSQSWKAFFYGSLDAANAITVDKPPASLWLMALSVRIFGLSSWSILAPQAVLGVATVGVMYASVRRTAGHWPAILGGAVLALTPAATLMFRFNNPDALLVFLLTLATYFTLRATEKASGKWLVGAGVLIGFGFLTKMLQAFLVLPAFVLVYLIAAPTTMKKRLLHLLAAFGAMIVSLGWWVAIVELVPASWRPYIGGSQNNSVLELVFGNNGLGRLTGNETGSVTGGGGTAGGMWGSTGLTRLFSGVSGGMIAWLLPAALLVAVFALLALGRLPRTNPVRANLIVWTGWLLVTGLTFSFMAGIYHDYYTVALAPAIAAVVALGSHVLWQRRSTWLARAGLAAAMGATTVWGAVLMSKAGDSYAALVWVIASTGAVATVGLLFSALLPKALAAVVVTLALVGGMTGPAAYSVQTAATAHQGSIVTAGPVTGGGMGGGGMGDGGRGGPGGQRTGTPPQVTGGTQQGGPGTAQGGTGATRDGGGAGGVLGGATVSTETATTLKADADSFTWVAAATGSQSAASFQLATGLPVMAIGGFNGSDPSPTLDQFKALVASGQIHYFIDGGQGGGPGDQQNGGSNSSAEIAAWVADTFTAQTVGGTTLYDLTAAS